MTFKKRDFAFASLLSLINSLTFPPFPSLLPFYMEAAPFTEEKQGQELPHTKPPEL